MIGNCGGGGGEVCVCVRARLSVCGCTRVRADSRVYGMCRASYGNGMFKKV